LLQFRWLHLLPVCSYLLCSTFVVCLYVNSFVSICVTLLSADIVTTVNIHAFTFIIIISGLFSVTSVSV
jgi:hypothetical protein